MKNQEQNYIEINKQAWDKKTEVNYSSKFYDNESFLKSKNSLNNIELNLLGDINGKNILHLQCHFGQDSITLANLGANVVAVDFSENAIQKAKQLSIDTNIPVEFICTDVFELEKVLDKKFDIIFTSYGVLGWLPDMSKWAKLINHFLEIQGKLILVEFHPVVWMMDYNFEKIAYSYFNEKAIIEEMSGSYSDPKADVKYTEVSWNHSLTDVINSLIKTNMQISDFQEYDYSPYNCFNNTIEIEKGKYMIKGLENKLPLVYSIIAEKKK